MFLGACVSWIELSHPTFHICVLTVDVVLRHLLLGITTSLEPSRTETHELVVHKSIPIIFPIIKSDFLFYVFIVVNSIISGDLMTQVTAQVDVNRVPKQTG